MNAITQSLTLLAIASSALTLSGCGSSVAGEYDCHTQMVDSHLVLSADGKLSNTAVIFGQSIERTGTWKADGNKVAGTVDGVTQTFTIDGDDLSTAVGKCLRKK